MPQGPDNKFLEQSSIPNTNVRQLMANTKKEKSELVKLEIAHLNVELANLLKTISNQKEQVRQRWKDYHTCTGCIMLKDV